MLGAVGAMIALTPPALAVNDVRVYDNTEPAGGYTPYECTHGHLYGTIAAVPPQFRIVNNCDVRVWVYESPGGAGTGRCIDPGATIFPNSNNQLYLSMKIGTSTNIC
jgi:hypothetical protein